MDAKTKEAIQQEMMSSSIPDEMKLSLLLASACQNVSQRAFQRIKNIYASHKYNCRGNDFFSGLHDYCKAIKAAEFHFFERINQHIINATWSIGMDETGEGNVEAHQGFENKVNECLRLIMKYLNCADAEKAYKTIFTALSKLEKSEMFEDKEISHFKIKL